MEYFTKRAKEDALYLKITILLKFRIKNIYNSITTAFS